ncbi:neuronal growth regulator 1-like [Dendronephthya gigantea]|uniref:neuronal growth regulator 1-like n=1 Tax=Dendronephthya gigantea TaxID=151771 RepID=UPI00106B3E18|nr:neuronal growth regulator 1-like [Dendronephthya gigantea]
MECFRMYLYVLLISQLILIVKASETNDLLFEGIEPRTVLAGNNATFRWKKIGTEPIDNLEYYVCSPSQPKLVYYYLKDGTSEPIYYTKEIKRYASAVEWTGNISRNEYAFTLRNVEEFSHKKTFCLKVQYESFTIVWFNTTALFISVPPEVQLLVDKTNVTVGDLVTIRCSKIKSGRPESKISWYHNDKLVPGKDKEYLFNQREIEAKDAGSYRCVAENDAGTDESNTIKISVHGEHKKNEIPGARGTSSGGGLGGGAIAGIVIGVILIVIIVIVIIVVMKKRGKSTGSPKKAIDEESKSAMVSNQTEKDQVWL